MAFFKWSKTFSVKIDSIDDQQRKLIELINDFYNNISNRPNKNNISKLISGMKEYSIFHFTTEDEYMKRFSFPSYEIHKRKHLNFISRVSELEEKFNTGKLILSYEITSFIRDWIKDHILNSDMQYSNFLITNGVN